MLFIKKKFNQKLLVFKIINAFWKDGHKILRTNSISNIQIFYKCEKKSHIIFNFTI